MEWGVPASVGPGHEIGTTPCPRRVAPGEIPRAAAEGGQLQPHAEGAKQDELSPAQNRARHMHPRGAGDGGSFPTPPERCFRDLLHRHGFETADAVGPGETQPGARRYFSPWSKAVGLDQSPGDRLSGSRCCAVLHLPVPSASPLQTPSQPQLSQRGYARLLAGFPRG